MRFLKPRCAARPRRWLRLLPLIAVLALGLTSCTTINVPTAATPTPPLSPTPTSFHALFSLGTSLDAIELATGTRIWMQALPGYAIRAPAIVGDVVAISLGLPTTQPPSGEVAAYAVKSGAAVWKQELGTNTQGSIFAASSMFVLATSAVSLEAPKAPAGLTVAGLQPADGSVIWRHTLSDTDLAAPILFSQGTLFVLSAQFTSTDTTYTLTALDAATGAQRWQKALGTGTLIGSAAGDGAVYVSRVPGHVPAQRRPQDVMVSASGSAAVASVVERFSPGVGTLTAYSASDGTQLWQTTGFIAVQAERAGTLYATVGEQQASGMTTFTARAYRATSGGQLWQSGTLGSGDVYQDKPVICADTSAAYVFNMPESQPNVHALSGDDGHPLWSVPLAGHVAASVAGLGHVYASAVTSPPAVAQTLVRVIALDSATGATTWSIPLDKAQGATLALL